jgi:hypothetical protein
MTVRFESIRNIRRIGTNALWRIVPFSLVVAVVSWFLGGQVVRPQHRMIKIGLLAVVLGLLLRYPMVYSLYFFVVIMPFPSGVVLTNTNVLLMTLIPIIWAARSRATGAALFKRTEIDVLVVLFLIAHVFSFWNVETAQGVAGGLQMFWRLVTTVALFYLIVNFMDEEKRLETMMKVMAISGALVALTAFVELFMPGVQLIPGWIGTRERFGAGTLGYRIAGMRVSGAIGSYDVLSDLCPLNLFMTIPFFLRAKNPVEKSFWLVVSGLLFVVLLATATRGGFVSFVFGFVYSLWVFRRYMNLFRYVTLICASVVVFGAAQLILDKYTLAASMTDRVMATQFKGFEPDTRVGLWGPILERAKEHIFIGHGPLYETSRGIVRYFWPHNGYLYFLFTVGLFGLSVFLAIAYKLLRISSRYSDPLASGSFLGLAMSIFHIQLVMFLVGQLRTDHQRTTDYLYPYVVWLLFGLIIAAGQLLKKKEEEHAPGLGREAGGQRAVPGRA